MDTVNLNKNIFCKLGSFNISSSVESRMLCIFTASPNHPGDYYKHNQIKHYICYASLVCSSLCVLCIPVETFVDSTYFSPLLSSKSEKNGLIQDMLTLMTFMNTKIKFKNGIKTTGTFL